jgi:hypothetical protein
MWECGEGRENAGFFLNVGISEKMWDDFVFCGPLASLALFLQFSDIGKRSSLMHKNCMFS